jgi:hypothetical protein
MKYFSDSSNSQLMDMARGMRPFRREGHLRDKAGAVSVRVTYTCVCVCVCVFKTDDKAEQSKANNKDIL